jgi:hypothetical protein
MDCEGGFAVIEKSCDDVTTNTTVVVCVELPLVAVMVSV